MREGANMAVIQETKANPRQNTVTIPQPIMREMGWNKGDFVLFYCDKNSDSVVMKRVQADENG